MGVEEVSRSGQEAQGGEETGPPAVEDCPQAWSTAGMDAAMAKAGRRNAVAGRSSPSVSWKSWKETPKSSFMPTGCSWLKSKAWVVMASLSARLGATKRKRSQRADCSEAAK